MDALEVEPQLHHREGHLGLDADQLKRYYSELFGWQIEDLTSSQGTYTMCRLEGRDVAGIHEHAADEGTDWSSSISVDDADRATARARELGATVLAEPFDVQGAGRTAVLRDPSGAVVSLWQPQGHNGAGLVNEVGTWTWNELVTPDLPAAKAFYAELFGWREEHVEAGRRSYLALELGRGLGGGIVECATDRALWLPYVEVPEISAAVASPARTRAGRSGRCGAARPRRGTALRASSARTGRRREE